MLKLQIPKSLFKKINKEEKTPIENKPRQRNFFYILLVTSARHWELFRVVPPLARDRWGMFSLWGGRGVVKEFRFQGNQEFRFPDVNLRKREPLFGISLRVVIFLVLCWSYLFCLSFVFIFACKISVFSKLRMSCFGEGRISIFLDLELQMWKHRRERG